MIVRILQLEIRPDRMQQFLTEGVVKLHRIVDEADGLLDLEILRPLETQDAVAVITRWRDEEAVKAWAGPMWRRRPVRTDAELAYYLAHSSRVSHYIPVASEGSPSP